MSCEDLRYAWLAAMEAQDLEIADSIRATMLEHGCPDPISAPGDDPTASGGGGHGLPPH